METEPSQSPFVFMLVINLIDCDIFQRLVVYFVERLGMIFNSVEINFFEVDTADSAVVHRAIVNHFICNVGRRSPLRGTWNICRDLALLKFYSNRNVKIV